MSILQEISEFLQKGRAPVVKEKVQAALDEGIDAKTILEEGLMAGMSIVGERFKNNQIFVPEVLMSARAMKMGAAVLQPHLAEGGAEERGVAVIGTVKGDLHDIGKNLVIMMLESKGIRVIDLGVDVPAERFVDAAVEYNAQVLCCSALLTSTMGEMRKVVEYATERGVRDHFKIMVGGAPVTQSYCETVGADCYTDDAASAAEAALAYCN